MIRLHMKPPETGRTRTSPFDCRTSIFSHNGWWSFIREQFMYEQVIEHSVLSCDDECAWTGSAEGMLRYLEKYCHTRRDSVQVLKGRKAAEAWKIWAKARGADKWPAGKAPK